MQRTRRMKRWCRLVAVLGVSAYGKIANTQPNASEYSPAPLVNAFNETAAKKLTERGIHELVFVKRNTFSSNHYYTEYINAKWMPGGTMCVLSLDTGAERDLVPEFSDGVFNRFDVSFDGQKIVFDYKKSKSDGYRIYEINADGTGLHQLTFPMADEDGFAAKYGGRCQDHTDDMHPCYLPDGGIAFVSTRCRYGILCDTPDTFTTKVLHRMNGDGSHIRQLSNSSVSEAAPVLMPDGRILYHRWEYNDKSQASVKCLWAMRPDGTGSVEIYGNTVANISTLIYGRPIPDSKKIVALGCSHCCPNNALGTVVTIDTTQNIRTSNALSLVTRDVNAVLHNGFSFLVDGEWLHDERTGQPGRLFKDPYPISEDLFIVSQKNKGYKWDHPNAYDLYLLNGEGESTPLYLSKDISCWHPMALVPREIPPILSSSLNESLAKENKAHCVVTDVYIGMEGVPRGAIKYLRIMEQVPRPWSAHVGWYGDAVNSSHTAVGLSGLGVKVQYGVVPVEADGSAYFEVPAERNIYFQALDENFMMVQTERTYGNYMPGETRSCLGCHETPDITPPHTSSAIPAALRRPASIAQPQPGDTHAKKTIDFLAQVQPVFDRHCITCHNSNMAKGGLDLSPTPTTLFTTSYENLMGATFQPGITLLGERLSASEAFKSTHVTEIGQIQNGKVCGIQLHPDHDNSYKKPYYSGSNTAPIVAALSGGKILPNLPDQVDRLSRIAAAHKTVHLSRAAFVTMVNWIDSFGQFYPSYWGVKNVAFNGLDGYRPTVSFADVINAEIPDQLKSVYANPPPSDHLNPKRKKTIEKSKK